PSIASRRTPRSRSPAWPGQAGAPSRSRPATCAGPSGGRTARSWPATSPCPAIATRFAIAPRPSACTCCAGCSVARNSRSERRPSGRPGSPRVRLFLALEPRQADRVGLAEWRDRLVQGRDDLRPSAAETLHLTLVFLGYQAEKDVPAIAEAALGAVQELPAAELQPSAIRPLPRRGPRLFALD